MTDWIEWDGGECSVSPDTLVDIRIRDGYEAIGEDIAKGWNWKHHMLRNDIVAYRIHHPNEAADELDRLHALTQQQAEQIAELEEELAVTRRMMWD